MTIRKRSLVDQVYERLRREIITLKRPLGSRLVVSELENELGLSCTPIREAINRLQQEGLVIYQNNIGASVLCLTAHDVLEIQQLALTLHCAAIGLSMDTGDRSHIIAQLRRHLEEYRAAATPQAEATAVYNFVGVFYHNCGNDRLDRSMIAVQGQQLLLRNLYFRSHAQRAMDAACFEAILDAVSRGDTEAARALLLENGEQMTRQIVTVLEQQTDRE